VHSLWLKNNNGEVWDLMLVPDDYDKKSGSLAFDINEFGGYVDEVGLSQVSSSFVVDKRTPKNKDMSCTMLFADHNHIKEFNAFIQDLDNLKLFYDPEGLILPETQVLQGWYKRCAFVSIGVPTQGKHGYFECSVDFTFLTSKWQRDTVLSSTTMGIIGEPLVFPFYYPFWFTKEGKIGIEINNENDETSCRIEITNNTDSVLDKCSWIAYYADGTRQLAEWMAGFNKLRAGRTLIVDGEPSAEMAVVVGENIATEIVTREQNISTKYENFVTIKNGINKILFDFGGQNENVEVLLTYREQVRMGLVI